LRFLNLQPTGERTERLERHVRKSGLDRWSGRERFNHNDSEQCGRSE